MSCFWPIHAELADMGQVFCQNVPTFWQLDATTKSMQLGALVAPNCIGFSFQLVLATQCGKKRDMAVRPPGRSSTGHLKIRFELF